MSARALAAGWLTALLSGCGDSPPPVLPAIRIQPWAPDVVPEPEALEGRVVETGGARRWSLSNATSDGKLHTVFDAARGGDFDVVYVSPAGEHLAVEPDASFQAHPSIAADALGRVWIAWDSGGADFGRGGPLHRERRLHLGAVESGTWHPVPLPPDALLLAEEPRDAGATRTSAAELPRLAADANGPIWLLYRTMTAFGDSAGELDSARETDSANRQVAWRIRALALTDAGWLGPVTLPRSDGPNSMKLALLPLPEGGIGVAYRGDNRISRFERTVAWDHALPGESELRTVALFAEGGAPALGAARPGGLVPRDRGEAPGDPDPAREIGLDGFERLWGDLHRHTDLSRCKMDEDGSIFDLYRYALDVAALDFAAVTDHFQHLTPELWEAQLRSSDFFDAFDGFVSLPGFERALQSGHWTMVASDSARAAETPFLPYRAERPFDGIDPSIWLAIPHQIADRTAPLDWSRQRPDLEPLVELFQSRRGSYEVGGGWRLDLGSDPELRTASDYLAEGRRFGFVGSSDHVTTGGAFTAVYATERSRASVVEALRARRCYAATARIALDVRLGELPMGAIGAVDPGAALTVRVDAGRELARVEVLRNEALARRFAGTGERQGLLALRVGRSAAGRLTSLHLGDGAEATGAPIPFLLEAGDGVSIDPPTLRLYAQLDERDEDGLIVPVRWDEGARIVLSVGESRRAFELDALLERSSGTLLLAGARVELRLDPPPLGSERLDERFAPGDWRAGDLVRVRVVTTEGEAAWSSPIFLE